MKDKIVSEFDGGVAVVVGDFPAVFFSLFLRTPETESDIIHSNEHPYMPSEQLIWSRSWDYRKLASYPTTYTRQANLVEGIGCKSNEKSAQKYIKLH